MKFAFIIFEDMTLLDFSGVYDPVSRLKSMGLQEDLEYDVCASKNIVKTVEGLEIMPDQVDNDLSIYDYIFIPGGNGVMKLIRDLSFLTWIKNGFNRNMITAVCGGSLVLGAMGILSGRKATMHPALKHHLSMFTENIPDSRIVADGNIITARGVTAAIDLGLFLCERIAGKVAREKIQRQMDYEQYTIV